MVSNGPEWRAAATRLFITFSEPKDTAGVMPKSSKRHSALVFEKRNYVLLLAGLFLIVVGFTAMYLDGQFEGFISLTVSPLLILAGYGIVGYAIMWWPTPDEQNADAP